MSKKYADVKRAAEAALRGLCRTIADNLSQEDADHLFIELSMSLFTASLDFELPFEKFAHDLAHKQAAFTLNVAENVVKYKHALDAGEGDNYDFKEI